VAVAPAAEALVSEVAAVVGLVEVDQELADLAQVEVEEEEAWAQEAEGEQV
jgi:hypothetical protein